MSATDPLEERAPWREPFRGGHPDPAVMIGMPGLDGLRLAVLGRGIRPPISYLTGLFLTEVDEGYAVFEMQTSEWLKSPQDQVSVGALMMLADGALGCAVATGLPARVPYTTAELSMSFLKPCAATGRIRAIGRLLHMEGQLALSDVWIEDARGERVAHGTSTCMVLPEIAGLTPPDEIPVYTEPAYDTPHPYERAAIGTPIPWEQWRTMSGLDILLGQLKGELPQPPIHYLTGMTLREASEGQATFTMPATAWLTSPLRTVQGGALAMLAHAALATAVTSTLDSGSAYRPVDVKVNFLRPVFAEDQAELSAHGTVTHRGRTLAVAVAEVFGPDGKKVVTATGATMIVPERPQSE
jgi:uncharacterized protein (TIGR00369 family)